MVSLFPKGLCVCVYLVPLASRLGVRLWKLLGAALHIKRTDLASHAGATPWGSPSRVHQMPECRQRIATNGGTIVEICCCCSLHMEGAIKNQHTVRRRCSRFPVRRFRNLRGVYIAFPFPSPSLTPWCGVCWWRAACHTSAKFVLKFKLFTKKKRIVKMSQHCGVDVEQT